MNDEYCKDLPDFTETSERPKLRARKRDSEDEESEYSASDSCDSDTTVIEST